MFIQTESTPNPNSLKFILDDQEMCTDPMEFKKQEPNTKSKLAQELLKIDGIENILINKNYISVNKSSFTWDQLKASILKVISDHFNSGLPAIDDDITLNKSNTVKYDEEDASVVNKIDKILSSKIRPAIMQDGGDVKFVEYDSGIVYLALKGSCAGCPSATLTLKNGIENLLKNYIAEVRKVEQV